jgi:excinuclease ABC subunit C
MIDLKLVPIESGCYLFRDREGKIIYVGKAKNLKKRVSTYFQKRALDPKTQRLVENIGSMDYVVTTNEVEAYLLENTLIKKHQPKYNIDLRESKRYAYIQITDEDFPRLVVARGNDGKGQFFGPFVSAQERDFIIKFLRRTFRMRTCKKIPKRPCLRYHMHRCYAPCRPDAKNEEYKRNLERIKKILHGKNEEVIEQITNEMKEQSSLQNYERAMDLRNQLNALIHLSERQNMDKKRKYDEDVLNYMVDDGRVSLFLFNVYKGTVANKEEFNFDYYEGFLEDFLSQYYSENEIPNAIIVPDKTDKALSKFLSSKAGRKAEVIQPKKGARKELLEFVKKNIDISVFGKMRKVKELQEKLSLPKLPRVIECFDISHLSGTSMVGSMVQFRNGVPDKTNYRRFKIRTVDGIDDFRAIAEIVRRRYTRLKQEGLDYPDLIIIDGGREQLNFALEELKKLNLNIPTISIAKKFEEIYLPFKPGPLAIDHKETALKYVQEIRDEAHRFAITYNRLLRSKSLKE